jgi:hypothetical protein
MVGAPTVNVIFPTTPADVAEMLTVPAATPVTRPVDVTVAMLVLAEVQAAVEVTLVVWPCELIRVASSWVVCPATIALDEVMTILADEEDEGAWPPHPQTSEAVHASIRTKNEREKYTCGFK